MGSRTITFPPLEQWQSDVYSDMEDSRGSGKVYVVKAKRQIGKSFLASLLLIKFSLEKKSVNAIVEPTLNQSRRVFKQITGFLEGSGAIKNANASLLTIDFINGSELVFKSAEQKDALRGLAVSGLLVIDEGAFITDEVYELIFPWVDANKAPTLIISTPLFADGYFYRLYNDSTNNVYDWSTYDTSKYLSVEKLEHYRKTMSDLKFRTEYLAEFITDGSYVFGNIYSCIGAYSQKQPIYLGIDWSAGDGNDYTWLTFMDEDRKVTGMNYFNDKTPTQQISIISGIINRTPSLKKVKVELNSIGSVYFDFLKKEIKQKGIIEGFTTTNDSKRRIIEQLVKAFQTETITIPNDGELINQLQHYAMEKTSKGYTYNGIGAHDDANISLSLALDCFEDNKGNYTVSFKIPKRKPTLAEKYG